MSYSESVASLKSAFEAVTSPEPLKSVETREPVSVDAAPMAYLILDKISVDDAYNPPRVNYGVKATLLIADAEDGSAEYTLNAYALSLLQAIETVWGANCPDPAQAGWHQIAGQSFRALELYVSLVAYGLT